MGEKRRGGVVFFFSVTLTPVFCLWLCSFLFFSVEVWNFRTALISGVVYQGLSQFLV